MSQLIGAPNLQRLLESKGRLEIEEDTSINPTYLRTPVTVHRREYVTKLNGEEVGYYVIDAIPVGEGYIPLYQAYDETKPVLDENCAHLRIKRGVRQDFYGTIPFP